MMITYSIRSVRKRYKIDVINKATGEKLGTLKWFCSVTDAMLWIEKFMASYAG
jgi:hypothetical protein